MNIDKVVEALENGDDELLAENMGNSLEEAAISLVPEIQEIKDYLFSKGLKLVLMSGSGSAVYALNHDKAELKKIMLEIEDKWTVELTRML